MSSLFAIFIILGASVALVAFLLLLPALVGEKAARSSVKQIPYECGVIGVEKKDTNFSIKFYLVAILFIIFDIEVIFMYPWALIYSEKISTAGGFLLLEMVVFMSVLIFGLFFVWKGKALDWE